MPAAELHDRRDQLARDNLIVFTKRTFPAYAPASHHWRIAQALQAIEARDIDRLVITMPPRHGKSELASVHFPAWFIGRNPDQRIIAASYAAGLAYRFSRRARNLLADPAWPFPEVATAGDWSAVQAWDIANHRGGYVAAGVGGGITGHGADVLLIDDPVASADEADSATFRERTWSWFTETALTRLEPAGRVVVIGTRWHEDDLIGRILSGPQAADWTVLHLPALDADGAALWPERYGPAALARIRADVGSRAFNAQYQGSPSPAEGAILKREWWRYWREPLPPFSRIVQSWDTAYKVGSSNDYSVGTTWGVAENGYYLLDRWRERVEFPALKRAVQSQYVKWSPREIIVEDAASGQSLIQELKHGTRLPIIPFRVDRDKIARVNAISAVVESGRVFLPAEASWLGEFEEEAAAFPFAAHDDQVDSLSMALARIALGAREIEIGPAVLNDAMSRLMAVQ